MEEKLKTAISRREFARRAAIASAAATASAVASLAPAQAMEAASALPAKQAQQPAGMPKLSPESQAEVDSRIQAIFSQYGSRFSDEQKADIKRLCTVAQPSLDRLRAYALENGDNPALYLKPLVEREKKPAPPQSAASTGPASPPANTPAASEPSASPPTPKPTPPGTAKVPPAGAAKKP